MHIKKQNKMRKKFYLLLFLFIPALSFAGSDDLKYDIESAGVSASGMTLVKVSVYVKKVSRASDELIKKAAVHGIVFRGVGASSVTGFSKQNALVGAGAAQQYGDYFEAFFADGGAYISYVTIVEATTETVKVGKEYRVSAVLNVNTDGLRQTLRDAGIARGMTDGF